MTASTGKKKRKEARLNIRLDADLLRSVKCYAETAGTTVTGLITRYFERITKGAERGTPEGG